MPLIFAKPAADRRQVFEAGLLHLVQLGRVPAGLAVNPNPQPIYLLSLKDIAGDFRLPEVAKLVSWRYFAGALANQVVAGDVSATTPPVITGLRYGDTARKALQANLALEALGEVRQNDFESRLLRIPGALVEGFWLKPPSADNGLLVPFGKTFEPTHRDGRPDSIDGFLHTLRPVREQVLRRADARPT